MKLRNNKKYAVGANGEKVLFIAEDCLVGSCITLVTKGSTKYYLIDTLERDVDKLVDITFDLIKNDETYRELCCMLQQVRAKSMYVLVKGVVWNFKEYMQLQRGK